MKKILALLLTFTFIFILSACGGSNSGGMTSSNSQNNNDVAETEDVDSDNKTAESAEPEYELSEFSTVNQFNQGYYWVTNVGSVPFRIVSFSADILNKEGLLIDSISGSYGDGNVLFKSTIPVYPGEKTPIILKLHHSTYENGLLVYTKYTADDIGKVNPSLRVEATDIEVSEIPCADDTEEDPYFVPNEYWIVTNDTEEDITAIVYYEVYDEGELYGVHESFEQTIKAGYKDRIQRTTGYQKDQGYSVVSTAYRIISKGGQSSN